jgi:hypothetical protein
VRGRLRRRGAHVSPGHRLPDRDVRRRRHASRNGCGGR